MWFLLFFVTQRYFEEHWGPNNIENKPWVCDDDDDDDDDDEVIVHLKYVCNLLLGSVFLGGKLTSNAICCPFLYRTVMHVWVKQNIQQKNVGWDLKEQFTQ